MKFLLREYLGMLKEDKELDTVITDLLFNMGIVPLTKPKKGRQHGVDICAVGIDPEDGKKKVFLMVIKQGDFTRNAWNKEVNSIRPTLDEIQDVYLRNLIAKKYSKLKKKVIVACNGELDQNVNQNWVSYTKQHSKNNLEFDFWGKDNLVQLLSDYSISEQMLPETDRMLLRKTISFLDIPDYDLRHFYQLIENILERKAVSKKDVTKKLRLATLCLNILFRWSEDVNNLKPAVIASERLVLMLWDWMRKMEFFSINGMMGEFYKVHMLRSEIGKLYFIKIQSHCYVKDSLHRYSRTHVEYVLLTWEHIGLISLVGLTELFDLQLNKAFGTEDKSQYRQENIDAIAHGLLSLINNNPSSKSIKYDEHAIEFTLAITLMAHTNNLEFARRWIDDIVSGMSDAYRYTKFFPLFHTSYDKLLLAEFGEESAEMTSSMILVLLAEWACILEDKELYKKVRTVILHEFKEVNLQMWFPEKDIEDFLYSKNATKTGSVKHSIELPENPKEYEKDIRYEFEHFSVEKDISIVKFGFHYLGYIASRHFRTYPLPFLWRVLLK